MQTKADIATGLGGAAAATWLTWGGLDALLAVAVGGLTICLLLIRIGLAVREWRQNEVFTKAIAKALMPKALR